MIEVEREAVKRILGDKPVAFHPIVAKICGSAATALYFSQMMYWDSTLREHRDGWFWKTQEEMHEETGLSRSEQETARRELKKRGWITEQKKGIPYRLWYHIEWDNFLDAVASYKQDCENPQTSMQDSANKVATFPQTITENTTESTTEIGDSKTESHPPLDEKKNLKDPMEYAVDWASKNSVNAAGVADPKKAESQFVKEIAPKLAAILQRPAISADRQAAKQIFALGFNRVWLDERLSEYMNGKGEQFRKDNATPFWIKNALEEERARKVAKPDAPKMTYDSEGNRIYA